MASEPEQAVSGQPLLLLVEDEPALRTLLVRFLERAGYRLEAAGTAAEALAAYLESPHRFAAAVLDLTLPDMPGLALLDALRGVHPTLPIVLTSGAAPPVRSVALPGPEALFLQKPFLPARLVEALDALLPAPEGPPQLSSSPSTTA